MFGSAIASTSMNGFVTYVLVLFTLSLISAVAQPHWEVINDVTNPKDDLDRATEQEILSREELIPYVRPKTKPRQLVVKEKMEKDTPRNEPKETWGGGAKKTTKVPAILNSQLPEKKSSPFQDEELLPLGVPHVKLRRLLQLYPGLGPRLPPAVDIRRIQQKIRTDNLSFPCKDEVDEDCLFDIDHFVTQKTSIDLLDRTNSVTVSEEDIHPLSRHKRQNNGRNNDNNNNNNDSKSNDSDDTEGSGTSSEELYEPTKTHSQEGTYTLSGELPFPYDGADSLTEKDKEKHRKDIEGQLKQIFKDFPGYQGVTVSPPKLVNGQLVFEYELVINGAVAVGSAADVDSQNLEEYLRSNLSDASTKINNLELSGNKVEPNSFNVNNMLSVFNNYCGSKDPCPNAGPEFNKSACTNTGFMQGYCPHKCNGYPCMNRATCEINVNYMPVCNCGKKFEGTYCEKKKEKKKTLSQSEEIGIGVAAGAAACAAVGCFLALCFRRKAQDVAFSYYEDEGSREALSDPTSLRSYYIDRPIVSAPSISVFNPDAGFNA